MKSTGMNLDVLLPFGAFATKTGVTRIVAEARNGWFGLLPRRLDCVAALTPGILVYETEEEGETYVAIDEGVLLKTGRDVRVSVRRAVAGSDLAALHALVVKEFLQIDERERDVRLTMARLEVGFLQRFAKLDND